MAFNKSQFYEGRTRKKTTVGSGNRTKTGRGKGKIKKYRGQGGPRRSVKN